MSKKHIYSILISALVFMGFRPQNAFAQDFFVSAEVTYEVASTQTTSVDYQITITNARTEVYAQKYQLHLNGVYPKNVKAHEQEGLLQTSLTRDGEASIIEVLFPNHLVGEGEQRTFNISFEDTSLVRKAGSVVEFSAPKLFDPEQFDTFLVRLKTSTDLGNATYINPQPQTQIAPDKFNIYYFSKEQLGKSGVTAAFGKFQVYSFILKYHLENPLSQPSKETIAIPADTAYQAVYITQMSPLPVAMARDEDGNWIATYNLDSRQKIDVEVRGDIQVYAEPVASETLVSQGKYLASTEYWQVEDPGIKALGERLTTPRAIYTYVVQNLKYSKDRAIPNAVRKGAIGALSDPTHSICMEFTDTFIALSRAAGIPAREVNGFAYSDNYDLEPLSMVSDVLHSWPEYWDSNRNTWIQVDPTWENTSGTDYFTQLDMKHLAFVKHGVDATKPYPPGSYKLGAYPQKDVYVSLSTLTEDRSAHVSVEFANPRISPFSEIQQRVKISNSGSRAIYDAQVEIYFDDKYAYTHKIATILPFGQTLLDIKLPTGLLGSNLPHELKLNVDGREYNLQTNRDSYIVAMLLIVFIPIILVSLVIIYKLKKLR